MTSRVFAIARYTLLEAWRTRLPLAAALALLAAFVASVFVRELSLIQDGRMQTVVYAAIARVVVVFIVALQVAGSLGREFDDKGLDTVLALDIPRWHYLSGKYSGYAALAAIAGAVAAVPLAALAGPAAAAAWGVSLVLETCIIAAVALFCVVTFSHLPSAMAFVAGFYLLCRAINGLRLVAEHPVAGETLAHGFAASTLAVVSLLVPPLDAWTRTAWLIDALPSWHELAFIAAEAAVYVALVLSAALIDFYRRSV